MLVANQRNGRIEDLLDALLEDASNFEDRWIRTHQELTDVVSALRGRGHKIVLTSGSFDILHEGHSMYLEAARNCGDFLIVGVDSDEKIRNRKGPSRPAVPEQERLRMVSHQRGVGIVFLKGPRDKRWQLMRAVRPDVLVATEDTYTRNDIAQLECQYCGRVEVLRRMATISTSARLRLLQLDLAQQLSEQLTAQLPALVARIAGNMDKPCRPS